MHQNESHEDSPEKRDELTKGGSVSRRQFLKIAGIAGATVTLGGGLGSLFAGCGGEETTTTTAAATTTTAAATTTSVSATTTTAGETTTTTAAATAMDRAKAIVEKFKAMPTYAGPTEPIDTAQLKGKKFYDLCADSSNAFNKTMADAFVEAAELCGAEVTVFNVKQNPALLNQFIMQGVNAKVDGMWVQAFGPKNAPNAFDAAKAAGIPINAAAEISRGDPIPDNLAGSVHVNVRELGALMVDYCYSVQGDKFKGIECGAQILTTDTTHNEGAAKEVAELGLPADRLKYIPIDLLAFQSKLAPQIQAMLTADDEINSAFGNWDILHSYVFAGIKAAGKVGKVTNGSWNGLPVALEAVNSGDWDFDIGTSLRWWSWASFDNLARLVLGGENTEQNLPVRLITKEAIEAAGGKMDEASLYGIDYETQYKALWGLA